MGIKNLTNFVETFGFLKPHQLCGSNDQKRPRICSSMANQWRHICSDTVLKSTRHDLMCLVVII